jgi:hypothetical protein
MAVHERFKSANFANLQIDVSAFYLIAAPLMAIEPSLAELEAVIGQGLQSFIEVGTAPWKIREGRSIANRATQLSRITVANGGSLAAHELINNVPKSKWRSERLLSVHRTTSCSPGSQRKFRMATAPPIGHIERMRGWVNSRIRSHCPGLKSNNSGT